MPDRCVARSLLAAKYPADTSRSSLPFAPCARASLTEPGGVLSFVPKHPVPVFPLPGVVLFPGAVLPLHVFELRYRTMVRDALSGERVIALALLRPGWEGDYHASPEFFPVACLARFAEVRWLPDDCYDLSVLGLSRVRLGRVVREFSYRAVRVQVLDEAPYTEGD